MKLKLIVVAIPFLLSACAAGNAPIPADKIYSDKHDVDIYSASDLTSATQKAKAMCGTDTVYFKDRAFANDKSLQELDKARWMPVRAVAYKFACDADFPHDDSTEGQAAWDAKGKKMQQDLEDGEEKLKQLYIEAGDPKQLISRSWEDADGNIHSYSLLNGTLCESVSYGASRQSNCHKVK